MAILIIGEHQMVIKLFDELLRFLQMAIGNTVVHSTGYGDLMASCDAIFNQFTNIIAAFYFLFLVPF